MNLSKKNGESDFQYHKRLVYGKLVDHTLADVDYTELSEPVYGKQYSSDVCRRMMYGSQRTIELLEENKINDMEDEREIDAVTRQLFELKKERQKLSDQRTQFNREVREQARQEELRELMLDSVERGTHIALEYTPKYVSPSDNDLLVSMNDLHYGIDINNNWNTYNPGVCKELLCRYLDSILEIASTHHSENVYVYNNGDSISGKIHRTIQLANSENIVEQVKGVSELIAQFLAELSRHFNMVKYSSVAGNHSRLDTREDSPYDERLDDLVDWYLDTRLQNFENIQIGFGDKLDPTMYIIDIRGKTYVGIHGDFDPSSNRLASLSTMIGRQIYAILCGHLHHCKFEDEHGILTIQSGSFVGLDDFCVQKRIYSEPSQTVCVCDERGVRCMYNVRLDY